MHSSSMARRDLLGGLLLGGLGLLLAAGPAAAKVYLSVDEALAVAFPGCAVERQTVYLTDEQLRQAREAAGVEIASALVNPYRAVCEGEHTGTAYFDAHRVRTLPETLMVVVDAAGKVVRVEVLSFAEPEEYLPRAIWYGQFVGQPLAAELQLKRAIRPVSGASLTARATTEAVRRVLALDAVLRGAERMVPAEPGGRR